MNIHARRLRRAVLAGGALTLLAVAGLVTAPGASAAPIGVALINQNASDPFVWRCSDPATGTPGICLVTSEDMNVDGPDGNDYPMEETDLWFLPDSSNPTVPGNWKPRNGAAGTDPRIFHENDWVGAASDAYHLWAPGIFNFQTKYHLFVPDVLNKSNTAPPGNGVHTSSRIGLAEATSPFGPYTWRRQLNLGTVVNNGYASDPSPYLEINQPWLAYADGDWGTGTSYPCGGISITQLSYSSTGFTGSTNPNVSHRVSFTFGSGGQPSWWNGCANNTKPYLEGPEIYAYPNADGSRGYDYVLMFAIKPSSTPSECATSRGQPGTANEAIAYATSTSLSSLSFQYKGIIMCGAPDSWTNQASMTRFANGRHVLFYHDAPAANPYWNRTLRAQCIDYNRNTGVFSNLPVVRATNNNALSTCWSAAS